MPSFRLPLAGPYTTRVSAVNTTDTSSGYVGIGIVGVMIVGKATVASTKDARYANCFASTVPDPISGGKEVYVVKRPGWGTSNTPATGKKGYAILVWTGNSQKVISAFDTPDSTLYDGTTSLGAITGVCTGITETFVSTTATLLATSTDSTAWYYDTGVGVMTQITDAQFPGVAGKTLVGTFANMDGFACILDTTGALWASDVNSVTSWTANSYGEANAYPDLGVAAVRFKNFIIAFGSESMQFFYNAGLSPFPLDKAVAMTIKVGAVSADAMCQISDNIFWAGSTPQGGLSIFQYDGNLSRISTPEIDAALIIGGTSGLSMTAVRFYGRSFVLVSLSTTTYAYCVEEKFWHEWTTTTPLWYKCAAVSSGGTFLNYAVSNISTAGKVFLMNHASLVFTDNGDAYTGRIQTPKLDHGTNRRKFYSSLDIIGDVEDSTSVLTVSKSDDDFATYDVLGTVDLSSQFRRLNRLGSARQRSWVLTHSAATPMRLKFPELQFTVGTS